MDSLNGVIPNWSVLEVRLKIMLLLNFPFTFDYVLWQSVYSISKAFFIIYLFIKTNNLIITKKTMET